MAQFSAFVFAVFVFAVASVAGLHTASAQTPVADTEAVRRGQAAFGDWREDAPGMRRLITAQDLPVPGPSTSANARVVTRPSGAELKVPPGFKVAEFARDLSDPRQIRIAPNGDVFIAESNAGRIRVLRPNAQGNAPDQTAVFASGLEYPFGIAFYPPGDHPEWIYVGETDKVVRFPYRRGDLTARGKPETIIAKLPTGGHATRDVVFSPDGARMFVSVGSLSNVSQGGGKPGELALRQLEAKNGTGASWGSEDGRATVLVSDPSGKHQQHFANGIRNCVGMAIHPATKDLWCATNERDGIGDNLPPDYVTRVRETAFYGWPWFYIGANEDPRHKGARPDLKDKVVVPDVLIQAHSAALGIEFYTASQFPTEYRGNAFVGLHGSWNRAKRTGYKIIRIPAKNGIPTGEYVDFVTGFVTDNGSVWGRPVGVAAAKDGSLLFTEDGNGTVWRVSYGGTTSRP